MAPILTSMDAPVGYAALRIQSRPSLGYDLPIGTSFTKIGCLEAENNCYMQTDRHTLRKCIYR